jgi:ferredoxin
MLPGSDGSMRLACQAVVTGGGDVVVDQDHLPPPA